MSYLLRQLRAGPIPSGSREAGNPSKEDSTLISNDRDGHSCLGTHGGGGLHASTDELVLSLLKRLQGLLNQAVIAPGDEEGCFVI
jgi:hypothetical protein